MEEERNTLIDERVTKLEALRAKGIDPYGGRFEVSHQLRTIRESFVEGLSVSVAGRIMAKREHGKSSFFDLKDVTAKVQAYFKEDVVGSEAYALLGKLDIGDIIGVRGELFKTRTGEPTIKVTGFEILSKSLRPLPEKWHGLTDVETRYRQRYVDLIVNDEVKEVFLARSRIVSEIRRFLDERGYIEVETPMMQSLAGGATGRPFKTHHEALDIDLYLRIAPELYLKRLIVGGLEKVYEINRNFRNEGISIKHNPEFTMLEVYTAYSDCEGTMALTEEMITSVAKKVIGKTVIQFGGKEIDLSKWERVSFADLMKENFDIGAHDDEKAWVAKLKKKGVAVEGGEVSRTQLLNIIGDLVEPKACNHPVFVVDLFTELCPLAKTKKGAPELTDRFELYMGGMEVANAYSELNDPIEQKRRFIEQGGSFDADFVRALEYGMPPAGGLGIGIDRLVMILTGSASIRDVILFPQLRPES